MTQKTSSSLSHSLRHFSFTVVGCLASVALLSVACSEAGPNDDSSAGTGGAPAATGGAPTTSGGAPAGTGGDSAGTGGAAACDIPAILNLRCGSSICHGIATDTTTVPIGNVNLVAPGVEARVYNIDATYDNITTGNPDCPATPEKLIAPGNLAGSLLHTKVNGGHACGEKMPNVGMFKPEELTCYNDWVASLVANPPQ